MKSLTRITAKNFLSLRDLSVNLTDLTVLVGPNGSGKSNFLNVFRFLGEIARSDLAPAIDSMGGISNVFFRGRPAKQTSRAIPRVALSVEGNITPYASDRAPDSYTLDFHHRSFGQRHFIYRREEIILKRTKGRGRRITLSGGNVEVQDVDTLKRKQTTDILRVQPESSGLAILRRLGDRYSAPQVERIAEIFEELRLFDVNVDAIRRPLRRPVYETLLPNAANVGYFLSYLSEEYPDLFEKVLEDIRYVYPSLKNLHFRAVGGNEASVAVELEETSLGGFTPLARASFGTIRAIALFAMLHDPNPPKLTCLEEVDHGLHPHALDRLVDRLRDASQRTQIVVATHSPAFVNRLSAEELVILERDPDTGATHQPGITAEEVKQMEEVSGLRLGELWFSGALSSLAA